MKKGWLVYPFFLLIALIAFYPAREAGFVFDFLGWQRVYDQGTFFDFLHSFGYKGNHQALHFFFYGIYALFHIQSWPWYFIFSALHALNAWLLFKWLVLICERWKIPVDTILVYLASILFLLHPYQVEAVVWKVCLHYLLSLACVLGLLHMTIRAVDQKETKWILLSALLYFVSIFLLEVSYITPMVISLYLLIDYFSNENKNLIKRRILLAGIFWSILFLGLLINRWTLGAWVGHYGAETHLKLDIISMISTELKYLVKHLAFARYFSFDSKQFLFDKILSTPEVVFFGLTFILGLIAWYFLRIRKCNGRIHLLAFGMLASMLFVLPVSNLFFYHLHIGTNDRFSYIPMTFLIIALTGFLSSYSKWFWTGLLSLLLLVSVYLREKHIRYWKQSTEVLQELRDSFRWHDRSHVFILNSPDNMHGIFMSSIIQAPSGIDELIDFQTNKPYQGEMFDVFQYNMTTPNDGVKVEQTGPMQLKVTFNQWGNWWHRNAIGASSYENEYYKAEILEYPYQITFKQLPENSVILYQVGKEWKEVSMSK